MITKSSVLAIARDDIADIVSFANKRYNKHFTVEQVKVSGDFKGLSKNDDKEYKVEAIATIASDEGSFDFIWNYYCNSNDIYIEDEPKKLVPFLYSSFLYDLHDAHTVTSSKSITSATITAADDDFESDDFNFDDEAVEVTDDDEDSLSDQLDDIADNVEDIQDQVDEVEEDDIDIDIDNNISGHYIAECDKCHGIFISSVILSDQLLEKVTGTCPLCDKESDQYLKWVVKDVADESV